MIRILLIIILLYTIISKITPASLAVQSGLKTKLSATIYADSYSRIFGYTSPSSIVQAISVRTFAQTISDNKGFFLLDEVPIAEQAKEICLSSIDSERRVSFPICVSIPHSKLQNEIGPIILSPTLSISQSQIWQNQIVYASGKTVPNEAIQISFFEVPSYTISNTFSQFLNKSVYAADLPNLETISDAKGEFSFTLPTAKTLGYRVFAKAYFKNNPTPKSQTLSFIISPLSEYFLRYILWRLLILLFILSIVSAIFIYDHKTKIVRKNLHKFIEKRLKPIGVRLHLAIRRQLYNYREKRRSNRK